MNICYEWRIELSVTLFFGMTISFYVQQKHFVDHLVSFSIIFITRKALNNFGIDLKLTNHMFTKNHIHKSQMMLKTSILKSLYL